MISETMTIEKYKVFRVQAEWKDIDGYYPIDYIVAEFDSDGEMIVGTSIESFRDWSIAYIVCDALNSLEGH